MAFTKIVQRSPWGKSHLKEGRGGHSAEGYNYTPTLDNVFPMPRESRKVKALQLSNWVKVEIVMLPNFIFGKSNALPQIVAFLKKMCVLTFCPQLNWSDTLSLMQGCSVLISQASLNVHPFSRLFPIPPSSYDPFFCRGVVNRDHMFLR